MRTWARHSEATRCGMCRRDLAAGEPRQVIAADPSRAVKRKFVRCVNCADDKPPADLPALVSRQVAIEPTPIARVRPMAQIGRVVLPFDYKAAQAGREPGSDDD